MGMEKATKAQLAQVEWLREKVLLHDGYSDEYEYKSFEVEERGFEGYRGYKPFVIVSTQVGHKGDEGTMAQIFARTRRLIWIGPRGGMHLLNTKGATGRSGQATGRAVLYSGTD